MTQNSDGSTLLLLLWIAWVYWRTFARSSSAPSDSKKIDGDFESAQNIGQRAFAEMDSIAVSRAPWQTNVFNEDMSSALKEVSLRDRLFSKERFLRGAAIAYEEIATAFASGDRTTLEALASRDVFDDLVTEIAERERRGEWMETRFVRIAEPEVTNVHLSEDCAELSVRFCGELFSVTRSKSGAIIRGSPNICTMVVDVWTFAKPFGSQLPDWKLTASNLA